MSPTGNDEICSQYLLKVADFVKAFVNRFEMKDAMALIQLNYPSVESFEMKDVKPLKGDDLRLAVKKFSGKRGTKKFTSLNGSVQNILVAMRAIRYIILGSPPSKVNRQLQ